MAEDTDSGAGVDGGAASGADRQRRIVTVLRRRTRGGGGFSRVVAVAAVVGTVCGVGVATVAVAAHRIATGAHQGADTATVAPEFATAGCAAIRTRRATSGTGPGDTGSAPGTIRGFQHAYYVQRSGRAAREYTIGGPGIPHADRIQAGIDAVPPGTRFCVHITPGDPITGRWSVLVDEQYPDEARARTIAEVVTVTETGGRWLITEIRSG